MSRRLLVTFGLAGALLTGVAVAQQPPPAPLPPGHPPIQPLEQTTPQRPPGAAPAPAPQRAPGVPPGRPIGPGGQQLPPGVGRQIPMPGTGGRGVAPTPPPRTPAPAPRLEECPGHGPMDAPHHINWFHGLLGVNNEKAANGGTLLWRYHDDANPCDPKNEPPPYLAQVINLGIFGFILYRFGRKPLVEGLAKRRQAIMQDIENSNRLKVEAEKRLKEYQKRMAQLDETLLALKADHVAQAEADRKSLLVELEERRAWMRRDAEFRIEQELKAARVQLLQEAVRGAVSAAEHIIQQQVTGADQQRLADDYLSSIPTAFGGAALRGTAGAATQSTGATT